MSTITVEIKNASRNWRDGSGSGSKELEITPEQFRLAFQGAQEALPRIEAVRPKLYITRPTIKLQYILDTDLWHYAWLNFEISLDKQILTYADKILGVCAQPKTVEAISHSIIEAFTRGIKAEQDHRQRHLTYIDEMLSSAMTLS